MLQMVFVVTATLLMSVSNAKFDKKLLAPEMFDDDSDFVKGFEVGILIR